MSGYSKIGRPTDQRLAMLRGLVTDTIKYGRINTTLTRAKEAKRQVDRMITLGKKGDLAARRAALAYLTEEDMVTKLFGELATKYADREGGYTRITRLEQRRGDAAQMARIELV